MHCTAVTLKLAHKREEAGLEHRSKLAAPDVSAQGKRTAGVITLMKGWLHSVPLNAGQIGKNIFTLG